MLRATESYRREEDVLGTFLEECCVINDTREYVFPTLYDIYREWCRRSGAKYLGKSQLSTALAERGHAVERSRRSESRGKRVCRGLAVTIEAYDTYYPRANERSPHE